MELKKGMYARTYDVLSDLTGANYLQEYICEPDGLLSILEEKEED